MVLAVCCFWEGVCAAGTTCVSFRLTGVQKCENAGQEWSCEQVHFLLQLTGYLPEQLKSEHHLLHLHLGRIKKKTKISGPFMCFSQEKKKGRYCLEAVLHPHTSIWGSCSRD